MKRTIETNEFYQIVGLNALDVAKAHYDNVPVEIVDWVLDLIDQAAEDLQATVAEAYDLGVLGEFTQDVGYQIVHKAPAEALAFFMSVTDALWVLKRRQEHRRRNDRRWRSHWGWEVWERAPRQPREAR